MKKYDLSGLTGVSVEIFKLYWLTIRSIDDFNNVGVKFTIEQQIIFRLPAIISDWNRGCSFEIIAAKLRLEGINVTGEELACHYNNILKLPINKAIADGPFYEFALDGQTLIRQLENKEKSVN